MAENTPDTSAAPDLTPAQVSQTPAPASTPLPQPAAEATPTAPKPGPLNVPLPPPNPLANVPRGAALVDHLKGLSISEIDDLLEAIDAETSEGDEETIDDEEDLVVGDSSLAPEGPVRYSQLEPGVQKGIAAVHNFQMEQALKAALDSDKDLSYNMGQAGAKARAAVESFVKDRMERLIQKAGDRFDFDWGRVAKVAVEQERGRIEPLLERPVRTGVGPGSGGDHYMTRELKEPQRVPAFAESQDHDAYIMERLNYNKALLEREQPGLGTPGN